MGVGRGGVAVGEGGTGVGVGIGVGISVVGVGVVVGVAVSGIRGNRSETVIAELCRSETETVSWKLAPLAGGTYMTISPAARPENSPTSATHWMSSVSRSGSFTLIEARTGCPATAVAGSRLIPPTIGGWLVSSRSLKTPSATRIPTTLPTSVATPTRVVATALRP